MAGFDSKIFNGEVFGKYVERIPNLKRNELLKSGALRKRDDLKGLFSEQTGSFYATVPMFGQLDGEALNYDGNTDITATTTTTFSQSMIVTGRSKAWVENDFSTDITGGIDFMDNVAAQVAGFWDTVDQETLLSVLKGIFSKGIFSLVIMHSVVSTNLENLNLVERLKYTDPNGIQRELSLGTWNGRTVIIDDGMPAVNKTDHTEYTTYVLGAGAIDYVDVGAKVPYEMDRNASVNGGQDTLYSRQRKVFAPKGISFTKSSVASKSPTNAELEKGGNWEIVKDDTGNKRLDHKAIAIARIISKG